MTHVRPAAVAGTFYPGDVGALGAVVRSYLADAPPAPINDPAPKAIIAPHAGYVYSGAIAATGYARFLPIANRVERVVILGPCHRVAVRGLAVSGADAFETPLGRLPVDTAARDRILALPQVTIFDATHAEEHSLEVHLPFIQEVFGDVAIVPLVVGQASPDAVAEVIECLWGGLETVFVISSDLSHYLDYETARDLDARTCAAIERLDIKAIGHDQACGRGPVAGMLTMAGRRGLAVTTLDLRNSGDTAGDKRRVVGYGAWMLTEPAAGASTVVSGTFEDRTRTLLDRHGAELLDVAAASILHCVEHGRPLSVDPGAFAGDLQADGACFVTLERNGRLRGCIGSPRARQPLIRDVADNAYGAAFRDSRFPNLGADEVKGLSLSISVLSPPEELVFSDERQLLDLVRPHADGLIIESAGKRALFLPSVWEQLPKPRTFLEQLKQKAGLSADHWSGDFRAWRFQTFAVKAGDLSTLAPSRH